MKKKEKISLYQKKKEPKSKDEIDSIDGLDDLSKLFDLAEEQEAGATKPGVTPKMGPGEGFKVFDFLDHEHRRLDKLHHFFAEKLTTIKKFPQTETLIKAQQAKLLEIRGRVIDNLVRDDSRLNKRLAHIWDSTIGRKSVPESGE